MWFCDYFFLHNVCILIKEYVCMYVMELEVHNKRLFGKWPIHSGAGTEGARGPMDPPIVGRSVNPIPTGEGRLSPPITTGTPNVFHLLASLIDISWCLNFDKVFSNECFIIVKYSVLTSIEVLTYVLYLRMCDFFPSFNDTKPWKRHGKQYQISKFKVLFAYSCKIYH